MKKYSIYKITNKINNKSYIGFSFDYKKRFNRHIRQSKKDKRIQILHKAIRKYGEKNFNIIELENNLSFNEAIEKEQFYIKKENTFYENGLGYNMTFGGEGSQGYKHTKKTKKLISEQYKKRWQNSEFIEKQSKNRRNTGKKHSKETIEKIVKTRRNNNSYKLSNEAKKTISRKNNGKIPHNTQFWLITTPDNRQLVVQSLNKYCKEVGIDHRLMHKVYKKICTHHKNYKCEKLELPVIKVLSLKKEQKNIKKGKNELVIYNNEWQQKNDIILSIVKARNNIYDRKIYARKCVIKEIHYKESRSFYDENHIQGSSVSSTHLGLFFNDELVSCMSFIKSRFNKNVEWELSRFVSLKHTIVLGGASKLFKHFIKNYNPKSIVSYADRRFFTGEIYHKLGFYEDSIVPPTYFYVHKSDSMTIHRKENFRHNRMKKRLKIYNSEWSEDQNTKANGYHKIFDCGKIRFIWNNN